MSAKEIESEREQFLRLPKAEFIIERNKGNPLPRQIGSMVKNEMVHEDRRKSIKVVEAGMEKSGIEKGNYVVVEKCDEYYEGEILAVQLGERILIRRLYNAKGRLRLEGDSPNIRTIIVEDRTPGFSVLGRVVQVIKEINGQ